MANQLMEPTQEWEAAVRRFRREMVEAKSVLAGMGSLRENDDVGQWLKRNELFSNAKTVPVTFVRSIQYIYVDETEGEIIGMIQLRCALNEYLKNYGGHIGYSIRPSARRKGYGKAMLQACLEKARKEGLTEVLITCDPENQGSRQVILSCGGVFQETVYQATEERYYEKYWITL